MDKEKFLRAKLKDFQHIFEQTEDVYEYAPDRGLTREKAVRDFLRYHLPLKYGVTTGKVLSRDGILSKQIDIIIYDAINCPILYSERIGMEYQIVPADSTIGVIEVKSIITPSLTKDIVSNLESFKKLKGVKNNSIAGFFGYSTPIFKTSNEIDDYALNMQNILIDSDADKTTKVGCVIPNRKVEVVGRIMNSIPCFLFWRDDFILDSTITKGKEKKLKNLGVFVESDPNVILPAFMLILTSALNKWKPHEYSMMHYYIQFSKKDVDTT